MGVFFFFLRKELPSVASGELIFILDFGGDNM